MLNISYVLTTQLPSHKKKTIQDKFKVLQINPPTIQSKKKRREQIKEHNMTSQERTQEGANSLGLQYLSRYSFVHFLLRNRRGYQRDTAPEPQDGMRTIAVLTDLQNNSVDRTNIDILLHTKETGKTKDSSFDYCNPFYWHLQTPLQFLRFIISISH